MCLQPDDIEGINLLYPVCTGRAMVVDTADVWRCNKSDAHIGYVRVLVCKQVSEGRKCTSSCVVVSSLLPIAHLRTQVYIFVPVLLVYSLLVLFFTCLRRHGMRTREGMRLTTMQVSQ